ncbi:hypothetical protein MMC09_001692 [Bachmanniomyces sp. S44760]|nr:hypothetical protein [Bachmanniomyces sp. S44760]
MDQFAQTVDEEDLFNDDFTPVEDPVVTGVEKPQQPETATLDAAHTTPRNANPRPSRGRGRGRGRPEKPTENHTISTSPTAVNSEPNVSSVDNEATKPAAAAPPTAVRGNRLGTGGIQKPKLTEEQLSAKLAAAKINNARREEAHRVAEADEASFQQREAVAKEKRREEGVNRRVMEGERERNRIRKLGAKGGREWDEEKKEEDFSGRRGGYQRGTYGSVSHEEARSSGYQTRGVEKDGDVNDETGYRVRGSGRGRGQDRGRGGRDGRGRGRGGGLHGSKYANQAAPAVNTEEEFPALSSKIGKTGTSDSKQSPLASAAVDPIKSPTGEKTSWADQVEAAPTVENA